MSCRRICKFTVLAALLNSSLLSTAAFAQGDPLALQKNAIQRIDAVVEHYRKTGDFQTRQGELVQADAELETSNQILSMRNDPTALALGLIKQGSIYRMQGQWQKAITKYQQAGEAAKRGRNVAYEADALAWRALAEQSSGNVGNSFLHATQAVRLAETTDDKDVLARALDILASAQISQNDFAGAADTLNREVAIAPEAKDPTVPFYAYLNRSDVYLKTAERCDFQRAFQPCYQALDHARTDLQQALAIARKLGYPGFAAQTEQFLRNVESRRALVAMQERSQQALQRNSAIFHPKSSDDILVSEKFLATPGAMPAAFAEKYKELRRAQEQLGGFSEIAAARIYYVDAIANEQQGNNDAALALYLKAIDAVERDRRAIRDERSRGAFLENRVDFYYAPILQYLQRRQYAEAFDLVERSRSRALADLLASRKEGVGRPLEQKLYAAAMASRAQIADAQGRLFELASQPAGAKSAPQVSALQGQIVTLEGQLKDVESRIAKESPQLQNLMNPAPATLKALQQSMRQEGYELLQYLVLEHGVIVWHITSDSVYVRNVFLPRTEVMGKVAALQTSLAERSGSFDEATAREFFLYLIRPVLARIRSDRLVIIPHEDLNYVPFQVFQDPADRHYLGERFQITYAPSASVLLGLQRSRNLAGSRLFAIADPGIPAALPEVQAIARLFPERNKVISDELAKESDVKTLVRDFDVIHIAAHGKFDGAEPMLSYLALGRSASDDGRLTAAEMFGLPLDKSRLVVLSACETGRAEATHGNEILGMVRALLYAGAETLVLSNWKVDSAATTLWMQSFYEAALSRPPAEAARTALLRVKSNPAYSHPYYWAAFTIVGR